MSGRQTARIVVDANIWLDFFLAMRPQHTHAAHLIARMLEPDVELLYPAHCLADLFYVMSSALKQLHRTEEGDLPESTALVISEIAWKCARQMADIAVAAPADEASIWLAFRMRAFCNDLEDCLVLGACEKCNADFLVTNDEKLLKRAPVAALSAEDMLRYLETLGK